MAKASCKRKSPEHILVASKNRADHAELLRWLDKHYGLARCCDGAELFRRYFPYISSLDLQNLIIVAQFISAAIVVASGGNYEITAARTYGIFVAVLSGATAVNIWGNSILGKWNTCACEFI